MKRLLIAAGLLTALATTVAVAKPINPNPGEGKYRFCQRMYDGCMSGVFGTPGSQSYNVGRARCYGKWTSCRKSGSWPAIAGSAAFDAMVFAEEAGLSPEMSEEEIERLEE